MDSSAVTKKLEEELKKPDALIEKLHKENEKLFDRFTEKASVAGSPQLSTPSSTGSVNVQPQDLGRNKISSHTRTHSMDVLPSPLALDKNDGAVALVNSGSEKVKSTPAGEYLTATLNDFDPDQYEGLAAISDGVNKLSMLVLAAVIKAGASREHEILSEIRDAVFYFIRKMEPKRVMDTMLVSRVSILYIRSLFAKSPELQFIKVLPVMCFLEKANTGRSRSSSRGNSPGRSPVQYFDEQIQGFKVSLKPEKKSKFSTVVLKIRGIDQILQQMRSDAALFTLEDGGSPIQNPSTAAEDARLASLISLDAILKQIKDITRHSTVSAVSKSKKRTMLASLDELSQRMPLLLAIDHPCAQSHIADARRLVESIPEDDTFKIFHMLAGHQQIWGLDLTLMWYSGMSFNLTRALPPHL